MSAVKSNLILLWFVALNAAYWTFGWFPDGTDLSAFVYATLVVFGSMLASTSMSDAYKVVKSGEITPGNLGVLAIFGMAFGSVYTGVFGVIYATSGRPAEWIGPISSYGRAMVAVCCLLMFFAPEATRQGIKPPRWWVMLIGLVLIALLAFLFGLSLGDVSNIPVSAEFDTTVLPIDKSLLLLRRA